MESNLRRVVVPTRQGGRGQRPRRPLPQLLLATLAACLAGVPLAAQTHGVPVNGYPNWQERASLVLVNMVRMAPVAYRDAYMTDWSATPGGILAAYPAVDPLYWNRALNEVARYHANDIGNTPGCSPGHASCDGTPFSDRVSAVYPGLPIGENAAWGFSNPRSIVNLWLCETSTGTCLPDQGGYDGHRANIMDSDFLELGPGYAPGTNDYDWYWTHDFGARDDFVAPSPLAAGGHILFGSGKIRFLLNFHDGLGAAPQSVDLILDSVSHEMSLDIGTSARGTYKAIQDLAAGCRSYHFAVVDGASQSWRYPEAGELRTFGEGTCTEDYEPDPLIFAHDFECGGSTGWLEGGSPD